MPARIKAALIAVADHAAMYGIISGVNYGSLLGGHGGDGGSGLLQALSGTASATGRGTGVDPLTALQIAQRYEAKDVAQEAKDPTVARDIAQFKKAVAGAKNIGTALTNPTVLKVLLTANGLSDQLSYTALARKTLMSDPSDPASLVNKLSDTRWKSVVQTFGFATNGLATLRNPEVQAALANGYAQVLWQQSLDKQTPGLANAMQFQKQVGSITNVDQILGDPVNRDVVLTALNIPLQVAYQSLAAQEKAISSRLDVTRLKDAHFVQSLTQQYLLNKAAAGKAQAGIVA